MNKKFFGLLVGVALFAGLAIAVLPMVNVHADNENNSHGDNSHEHEDNPHKIGSTLEVHVFDNGMVLVRGAKVTAVSGNTISAVTAWGSASLSWTVNSDNSTEMTRRSGGQSNISEISVGDFVSFKGQLVTTSPNLTVNAKILKNWSVQKRNASFIGKVSSLGANSFVLNTDERGQVTVNVVSATTIMKSDATATFADIHVGDKVSARGMFDDVSKVLTADKVKIFADKMSEQHVFQGTLKAIAGTAAPTSFTLTLDENADVTVSVPAGISIIGRSFLAASLADFRVGDKIRVFGLREGTKIDATVVRNVNLPR